MESGAGGGEASDGGLSQHSLDARFQRLKEESRAHPLQEDSEILGAHLALRLAALKCPITQTCKPETWALSGRKDPTSEVEKLLESISDEVRLQKSEPPTQQHGFDQETSDSDVDNLVEWAKDAAALDPQLADEEDFDGDVLFMPVPKAAASIKRFTTNEVRMQKSVAPTQYRGLDKKSSGSDVDSIIEWAKEAAAFHPHLADEADLVFNGDVSNMPVPGTAVSIKKKDLIKEKKDIRWKFW